MSRALTHVLGGLALVLAAAACGGGGDGTAGATPSGKDAFDVLVIGDFGVGGEAPAVVARGVRRWHEEHGADLLLTVGDNNYSRSAARFRERWRARYGWVERAGVEVAGVLGNHDLEVGGGRYQFSTLGMPGPYYTKRRGDAEFFLLDSNRVSPAQTRWLRRALASSPARWKVAVAHHSQYSCGTYRGRNYLAKWLPLFRRYGVRLVLTGHDHNYQRFADRGTMYIVAGGGGARTDELRECLADSPTQLAKAERHSFLSLRIASDRIEGVALTPAGDDLDSFTIR